MADIDSDVDSLATLPSPTTDDSDSLDLEGHRAADREWKESLQQLELLLTMVLVPYVGKYFGRRAAYWGWARFMEWRYPVHVVMTSPSTFKGMGAIEAALTP